MLDKNTTENEASVKITGHMYGDSLIVSDNELKFIFEIHKILGCNLEKNGQDKWIREDHKKTIEQSRKLAKEKKLDKQKWFLILMSLAANDKTVDQESLDQLKSLVDQKSESKAAPQGIPHNNGSECMKIADKSDTSADAKNGNVFGIDKPEAQQVPTSEKQAQNVDLNLTFSHTGGELLALQSVTISCPTKGAEIRYTTDDTEPNRKSPKYKSPIVIDRSVILRAQAFLNGQSGVETKAQYKLGIAPVEFVRESGDYNPPVTVAITCKNPGAVIRYTEDGSEPVETSKEYSEPFNVTTSCTVRARAFKSGMASSEVTSVTYNIKAAEWKNIEPADPADNPVEHIVKERIDHANGWSTIAASVRGKLHAHNGSWREDSFKLATEGPWTIIAVADGMGSAPRSRIGSRAACDAAVSYLLTELHGFNLQAPSKPGSSPETIDLEKVTNRLVECAKRAKGAIEIIAAESKLATKLFATTLLVCIHCPWGESDFSAAIQVGDGCIATLRDQDGTAGLLTKADHGEFSSQTRPITEKNIEREFGTRIQASVTRIRCIAVMTDGISDDFFPEEKRIVELFDGKAISGMTAKDGKPVNGLINSVLNESKPEEALLSWMTYDKKQSADDRTLVVMFRRDV